MSHLPPRLRRRQLIALLAALPFAASAQPRLAPRPGSRLIETRSREAAARLWPGHAVQLYQVRAREGVAALSDGAETPTQASLVALANVFRPAENGPHHVAVHGANPRMTARTILGALLYTDLRPPLQLHLAFIGRRDFGEALGQQIRPALAEYVVLDLDEERMA